MCTAGLHSSPSSGGDAAVHVLDGSQPSLPTPFYSVLVSVSVFMALSSVFNSINSPDSSPLSLSVLPVCLFVCLFFSCLIRPFNHRYLSL